MNIRQDMLTYIGDARSLSEAKVILCRQGCEQILRSVTMNSSLMVVEKTEQGG